MYVRAPIGKSWGCFMSITTSQVLLLNVQLKSERVMWLLLTLPLYVTHNGVGSNNHVIFSDIAKYVCAMVRLTLGNWTLGKEGREYNFITREYRILWLLFPASIQPLVYSGNMYEWVGIDFWMSYTWADMLFANWSSPYNLWSLTFYHSLGYTMQSLVLTFHCYWQCQ